MWLHLANKVPKLDYLGTPFALDLVLYANLKT